MISISVIKQSASNAADYYIKEEKNYYLEEKGENNSQWFGAGAEINDIFGKAVEQKELEMFLSGKTYDGSVSTSFKGELRRGWDFTLSAPKSVSILALVYGDKELLKAHDIAVKNTLSQIEKDAAQVRIFDKEKGEMTFQNTGNVIAAMIRHSTSREMDPQLHTHSLICNISYDKTGKVRAMASSKEQGGDVVHGMAERVYRDQKYYTAIYQSSLAKLASELGYKVRSVGNGQFEIEGIPQSVISEFSQRREQIVNQAQAFGVTTSKGMDVATQATRKNKVFASMNELRAHWSKRHTLLNISEIKRNDSDEQKKLITPENAHKTIDLALSHLGRFHTKITYEKLMETALGEFAIEEGVDYLQCQSAVENKIQSGEIIPLDKNQSVFTTQTLLKKEKELISTANVKFHHLSVETNKDALNQLQLSGENKSKLVSILETSKQAILIDARGSQKQLIEGLLHASENSGLEVTVLSPNRIEKNQLAREALRQSSTLSQWIKNQFRDDCHDTVNNYLHNSKLTENNKLIIVNQANRLGVDEITGLLRKTQEYHTKIVFVNNDNKIKSNRFGNSIETLKQADIYNINWYNNKNSTAKVNIHTVLYDNNRFKKIIDDYVGKSQNERLKTQVIALNKKDVFDLNSQIRDALKGTGEIGRIEKIINNMTPVFLSNEEKQIINNYQSGMILKIFNAENSKKLKKVETFNITDINKQENRITLKNEHGKFEYISIEKISEKQFMLFKIDKMAIAKGDVIRSLVDINHLKIKAGDKLSIKSSGILGIHLVKPDGTSARVHERDLEGKSFQYDYVKSAASANNNMDHTLLLAKSYAANDKILNTLLDKTNNSVEIYTNNEKKIKAKLAQSYVQPTAINTVIDSAEKMETKNSIEKFVNDKTNAHIKMDLESALSKLKVDYNQSTVDKSVEFALSNIGEKEAAFRHQDLVKEALSFALSEEGSPLHAAQIEEKLAALKNNGLIFSADYEDGTRWTTKEALSLEKNILNLIQEGKKQVDPLADKEFVLKSLGNSGLTPSQQEAVFLITTTRDRFIAIQGLPGTGKSTMLLNVTNIVDEVKKISGNKIEFIGLAPTWQAVNELEEKGVKSQTLASFLQEVKPGVFDKEQYRNTVFLLDESSMVSNKDKSIFLNALNAANSRAVDVGDMEQLQGQGAGKPFELAIKRGVIECVYLTDIIRQNPSPVLKMAVEDIIDKDIKKSFIGIENQNGFEKFGTKKYSADKTEKGSIDEFVAELNVKNIIETYEKSDVDDKINKEKSKEKILVEGATEYLQRTPESRANSVFILYSNRERDKFSEMVREGLKSEGVLNKKSELEVDRLRPLNATRVEMRTMDAYILKSDHDFEKNKESSKEPAKLILSIGKNKYYEIDNVDKETKLLTLTNIQTKETKIFNPLKHDHSNTCLWSKTTQKLAEGDLVVMRRADNERGHIPNIEYAIKKIDKASKVLTLQSGDNVLALNTDDLKDCHWDYAYSKTTDMAQGSTRKFVVFMVAAESMLTNIRRAIVDMSRATTHAMFITDRKEDLIKRLEGKTLQSVANNHGDKRSSLDTIEKVIHAKTHYFDHSNDVSKISIKNETLYDENKFPVDKQQTKTDENRVLSVQSIYSGTSEIKNTLGERYLTETRKISIDTIARSEVRFWEKESSWKNTNEQGDLIEQKNKMNALVIPAVDKDGKITGVQRIYLENKSPEKNKLMSNPKLSKGIVAGSPGVIQQGTNGKIFVAEGPETALSIAEVEPHSTVLCAFSVDNFRNMKEVIKSHAPTEVIIAGDNDGINSNAYRKTEAAKDQLAEFTKLPVTTIYPDSLPGKSKTDFNDILINLGKKSLSDMITRGLKIEKEINAGLIEKYQHAINTGLSLDDVNNLARSIGSAQSVLKLDAQKYHDLASIINKSNDINKIIDGVKTLENNHAISQKKQTVSREKSMENIDLEI